MLIISAILLSTLAWASLGNDINPLQTEVFGLELSNITVSCSYSSAYNLHWYRQYPESAPEFLLMISHSTGNIIMRAAETQISGKLSAKKDQVDLLISSAAVSDSALYYCALTSGGYKIIFSTGTKLIIETREKIEPAHYTVRNENVEACLTTNLAAPNSTDDYLKDAVRFSGESFYSSLSLNKMCDETAKSCNSGEEFYQSEKTNFLTLSIYWLRVLFVKTIVFNVLMTLKVWIS